MMAFVPVPESTTCSSIFTIVSDTLGLIATRVARVPIRGVYEQTGGLAWKTNGRGLTESQSRDLGQQTVFADTRTNLVGSDVRREREHLRRGEVFERVLLGVVKVTTAHDH